MGKLSEHVENWLNDVLLLLDLTRPKLVLNLMPLPITVWGSWRRGEV